MSTTTAKTPTHSLQIPQKTWTVRLDDESTPPYTKTNNESLNTLFLTWDFLVHLGCILEPLLAAAQRFFLRIQLRIKIGWGHCDGNMDRTRRPRRTESGQRFSTRGVTRREDERGEEWLFLCIAPGFFSLILRLARFMEN